MKRMITSTMITLLATVAISTAATPDKAAMEAKEKAAWQAFKDKNEDAFKKLVDKDLRCVFAEGINTMQNQLDDMKKWYMKSFAISDYKVTSDGPDTVVTTFKVAVEGTYDGKDQSGTYNAATVWKQERGAWMAIFHTNVKEAPAAKPAG